MALGDGTHKLPVKTDIREAIGKHVGDTVSVVLEERIITREGVERLLEVKPELQRSRFPNKFTVSGT